MLYDKILKLDINNGPSKMDLITAFAYAYDKQYCHDARFTVSISDPGDSEQNNLYTILRMDHKDEKMAVRIAELGHDDGSGRNFNFRGYDPVSGARIKGYYSAERHEGWMRAAITLADDRSSSDARSVKDSN